MRPERLPPTEGAAHRAYLQLQEWITLSSLNPLLYGWKKENNTVVPIGTLLPIAPDMLLNFIACKCEKGCRGGKCSCVSNNVKCVASCTNCKDSTCENSSEPEQLIEDDFDPEALLSDDEI